MNITRQLVFEESSHIEDTIVKIFDETSQQMVILGKEIVKLDNKNLDSIISTIKKTCPAVPYFENAETPSWHFRGWASTDGLLLFSCMASETLKNPINLSHRVYVQNAMIEPWKLHFSSPSAIALSGLWGIPVGMSITTEEGKHLGIISSSFNISELNLKIHNRIINHSSDRAYINFVVLDNNYRVILQSPDNAIDMKSAFYSNFFRNKPSLFEKGGLLKPPIVYKNIEYASYKKIRYYPYIVLTGYNKDIINSTIIYDIAIKSTEFFVIYILSILLLYFFQRDIILCLKKSDMAQRKFMASFIYKHQYIIKNIIASTDVVMREFIEKYFSEGENVEHEDEMIINETDKISRLATDLLSPLPESISLSLVNINCILEECTLMQSQHAFTHGISIQYNKPSTIIAPFYGDEVVLKQNILGMIFLSIKYTPHGGKINLYYEYLQYKNQPHVCITLEDNGLPLSSEDIERIEDRFNEDKDKTFMHYAQMNIKSMKKLAELCLGKFILEKKELNNGKIAKFIIPYLDTLEGRKVVDETSTVVEISQEQRAHDSLKKVLH